MPPCRPSPSAAACALGGRNSHWFVAPCMPAAMLHLQPRHASASLLASFLPAAASFPAWRPLTLFITPLGLPCLMPSVVAFLHQNIHVSHNCRRTRFSISEDSAEDTGALAVPMGTPLSGGLFPQQKAADWLPSLFEFKIPPCMQSVSHCQERYDAWPPFENIICMVCF